MLGSSGAEPDAAHVRPGPEVHPRQLVEHDADLATLAVGEPEHRVARLDRVLERAADALDIDVVRHLDLDLAGVVRDADADVHLDSSSGCRRTARWSAAPMGGLVIV